MLSTSSNGSRSPPELAQKTLLIKHDDKFFGRLLSREMSIRIGSFRGLTSSVPFTWESQPGTPKHHSFCETVDLPPPLTPPPSYYSKYSTTHHSTPIKKQTSSASTLLSPIHTLFLKLSVRKKVAQVAQPSSPSISSHCSTSPCTSSSVPGAPASRRRIRLASWGGSSSSSSKVAEEDNGSSFVESPTSTLCFRIRKQKGCRDHNLQNKALIIHQ